MLNLNVITFLKLPIHFFFHFVYPFTKFKRNDMKRSIEMSFARLTYFQTSMHEKSFIKNKNRHSIREVIIKKSTSKKKLQ